MSPFLQVNDSNEIISTFSVSIILTVFGSIRMNRRKADFKFAYKFLEDDL